MQPREDGVEQRGRTISQIWCLSLMTLVPHGKERKPSFLREMMSPETDNLKPAHLQPTHSHEKKTSNCSSSVSIRHYYFSLCLLFCFSQHLPFPISPSFCGQVQHRIHPFHFSILCHYLTELNPQPVLLFWPWTICLARLWQIKPTRYMAITFTG